MELTVDLELITPEVAREMLGKSRGNPRWTSGKMVNIDAAKKIAQDIIDDNWHIGSGDIIFDEDGILVDGHTRLTAVTIANKPIQCFVKRGVTKEGLLHIDDNKARTDAQRLHTTSTVTAVPAIHALMCGKDNQFAKRITVAQKQRWLELHPSWEEAEKLVSHSGNRQRITRKAGCLHGCICAIEYGVSGTKLEAFFSKVASGFIDNDGERAAIALRNQLISIGGNYSGDRSLYLWHSIITQAAIYDFTIGRPRTKSYRPNTNVGKYFEMLALDGDERYLGFLGKE